MTQTPNTGILTSLEKWKLQPVKRNVLIISKQMLLVCAVLLFCGVSAGHAQGVEADQAMIASAKSFTGAAANKKHYNVIYQLNTDDAKIIKATLRNIANALEDPRLKGKLSVELVAFSGGWQVYNKDNDYAAQLLELKKKGVILAQCHNTLKERKIPVSQLLPFVSIVPSGNGELIIRQAQGWSVVKP